MRNTLGCSVFLVSTFLPFSCFSANLLNTSFNSHETLSAVPTTKQVSVSWGDVRGADVYKVVEKTPSGLDFVEKVIITDTESLRHEALFELPLPNEGETHVYTYKVIGCVIHHITGERLCESAAEYSLPAELHLTQQAPFTPQQIMLSYEYDELGRLTSAKDPQNGDRLFDYDPAGNRTQMNVLNNGSSSSNFKNNEGTFQSSSTAPSHSSQSHNVNNQ